MNRLKKMDARGQRGVVLVLSLVLLVVMTILGVAAMSSVNMQERMAGNVNLQARAFETASGGVATSLALVNSPPASVASEKCGGIIPPEEMQGEPPDTWTGAWSSDWVGPAAPDFGVRLRQRLYCLGSLSDSPKSQLFVLNRGEVFADGVRVAVRDIEVRVNLANSNDTGIDECKAICIPGGTPDNFGLASSGAFSVIGGVTVGDSRLLAALEDGVKDQPNGNYIPAGDDPNADPFNYSDDLPAPWGNVEDVVLFSEMLRDVAYTSWKDGCTSCYFESGYNPSGGSGISQFGTSASPQVTFVNGNLELGGSPEGAGILVVNGDLTWNGNAQFYGLVIVLGGTLTVTGGGNGGVEGSFVMAPIGRINGDYEGVTEDVGNWGTVNLQFHGTGPGKGAGGGNQTYVHDCDQLKKAASLLSEQNGQLVYNDSCGSPVGGDNIVAGTQLMVSSWRENIGWREFLVPQN